jgi:putative ABC transport system permease protein
MMAQPPFDLDKAIASWRHVVARRQVFSVEDIDELERHLRDHTAHLASLGRDSKSAFEEALRSLGNVEDGETEYRKVRWGKLRRHHRIASDLIYRSTMLENYLKIAWRNVAREKGYAAINVVGLAVGIALCTLIFLFVRDELTFDRFHAQGERIFRVEEITINADGSREGGGPSGPIVVGPAMQADIPGIQQYIRFLFQDHYARVDSAALESIEERVAYADAPMLETFTFPLRKGNPETALDGVDHAVLTESVARRHFGDENPIGRTFQIRLDQTYEDFVVTAVAADPPGNSTIQFGVLLPFERLFSSNPSFRDNRDSWHFYWPETYVALAAGRTERDVEALLPEFHRTYHEDDIARQREDGTYDSSKVPTYDLKPIRDIHLTGDSDPVWSYILSGIAAAVLLIACINFTTLSMGRSARRAREVGVRKVVGAGRRQLMAQFWGEAFLLSASAALLGVLLAAAFLPVFNDLTGKGVELVDVVGWTTILFLIGLIAVTGLIAGGYPAFILSAFQPVETLRNQLRFGRSSGFMRTLVVLQFALTVFLITSTLIMARQLAYTRSMDLGFDKDQVVLIPTRGLDAALIAEHFRSELESRPQVVGVTASGNMLGRTGTMGTSFRIDGKAHTLSVFRVDEEYVDFLGLELLAGRNFSPTADDSGRAVIVNEAFVRDFGLEDPIGKPIPRPPGDAPGADPVIVGVVKDYHFQSLYKEVGSVLLTRDPGWQFENVLVRIRPEGIPQTVDLLRNSWQGTAPDLPFTYQFLDDQMQSQYANDRRWSQIVRYAALFAVLIACLGLLGQAALSVTRRTKEIGIRKVLGATLHDIVLLISREFAVLVTIGIVVAAPTAYLAMQRWLEDFAYRIPLSGWMFLAAGCAALLIALMTVGYHAVKSALTDPVKSLRYE